jgi:4-methylaminobutanoate oxidase (formaldehyde-forming)
MLIERVLRRSRGVGAALARHQRLSTNAGADSVPSSARAVIIGGGIIGNSIAYHLTRMGIQDVLLLEQHNLTAGTTWHAAGLMCTFGSMSETSTEIRKYSKKLYSELEAETGQSTGFKPIGFIELAAEPDRLEEYRRISAINRKFGVDVQEITPKEVEALFPLCRTDDILAGFYVPDDGRVNPIDASMALAKGARMKGAKICEGVRVVGISEDIVNGHRKVTGVMTEDGGHIQAEYVVNCAGMWARQLGEKCGVNIPNQAAEHYYIVTDEIEGVDPSWPIIEDTMSHTYIRPEGAGLMVGLFEPKAASWNVKSIPDSFAFGDITPDWERMGPYVETAMNRVPATLNAGIKTFFCGPESFTPDLAPIVGEAPEIRNYFVAAGVCPHLV